jgi:hypothetical protein
MREPQSSAGRAPLDVTVAAFASVAALGAFLLFEVQLVLGKRLLPWFGGASGVWTTCLLFFQGGLLAGYAWAHLLVDRTAPRRQLALHAGLVGIAIAVLAGHALAWPSPITPAEPGAAGGLRSPALAILALLGGSIGVPYVVLAATTPLLHSWLVRLRPQAPLFWLFALSNAGSLGGLAAYPLLVEPQVGLRGQGWLWTAGFVLYAVGLVACALSTWRTAPPETKPAPVSLGGERASDPSRRATWVVLAACPALALVAVSSHLTQEVAAVPLLWVLPLAVYLVTFILCFADRPLPRAARGPSLALAAALAVFGLFRADALSLLSSVALWATVLFVYGMVGHGELARRRPGGSRLTAYYLAIAAGGTLGGLVNVLAPTLLTGRFELHLALLAGPLAVVWLWLADPSSPLRAGGDPVRALRLSVAAVTGLAVLAAALGREIQTSREGALFSSRSFFGVLRVRLADRGGKDERLELLHGRIVHGTQLTDPARRLEPTAYFGPSSGAGLAIRRHPRRLAGRPLRVGVIGLGVGTLAAWSRPGDVFRFYELDPAVVRLSAGDHPRFTFLRDAAGETSVVVGDGRLTLENEPPQGFQVLVLDAFSSDAIPSHLLTREAFAVYARHLAADGVLAVHVTNRWVNLRPVVRGAAAADGLVALHLPSYERGTLWPSDWMLAARDRGLLQDETIDAASLPPLGAEKPIAWTDGRSDLLGVLKR